MANKHTIILMQCSNNRATRTFMDYGSISQAMDGEQFYAVADFVFINLTRSIYLQGLLFAHKNEILGICGLYERKLKELNPAIRNITYDIGDLYNFIDGLVDLSALVYDHSVQGYLPYDREWIKHRTFQHLKKLARRM